MIDISKIVYHVVLVASDRKQHDISDYVEDLGWEENDRELALRISFSVINENSSIGPMWSILRPNCLIIILAEIESKMTEVARGYIVDWNAQHSGETNKITFKCYDETYNLQKSQEPLYYSSGKSTKSVLSDIFNRWNIPCESYAGPDVTHGKLTYKTERLSDVIVDILDDAKKKGGGRGFIRSSQGKVQVLKYGHNSAGTIYCFEGSNSVSTSHKMSTADMVTRVKVISQENDDEQSSIEATIDGQTQYGIRQRIYSRSKDDSRADAKKAAQEIIDEDGNPSHDISLKVPDVPVVRKGDLVYCNVGTLAKSYCYVLGVQHDADKRMMTLDLEETTLANESITVESAEKTYSVGDIVTFNGGTHYVSSTGSKGYKVKGSGQAKITIVKNGAKHPYHLIHTDSKCNVYGWVDSGTFT